MRINELTPEEHSIVKILRLMSDPDREWTIKIFWVCAGVVVRQWSTPNDKVKKFEGNGDGTQREHPKANAGSRYMHMTMCDYGTII